MKMKHTPGPWEYGEERGCCREIHADNGPELYAIAQTRHGDPEICEANARLIAAAPDLLDELETLVRYAQGADIPPHVAVDRARAAIAKAEWRG